MLTRFLVLLGMLSFMLSGFSSRTADADALQTTAQAIADQVSGSSNNFAPLYAESFLEAVPIQKLSDLYASMRSQYGPVLHVVERSRGSSEQGKFEFDFKQLAVPVTLTIESAPTHRVVGLWFGPAVPRLQSLQEVVARLASLEGPGELPGSPIGRRRGPGIVESRQGAGDWIRVQTLRAGGVGRGEGSMGQGNSAAKPI